MTEPNAAGTGAPTTVGDSLIGKEIDGCAIVKKIGQGGMGIVYLAEHTKLRQQYVVKILNPALVAAEDTVQRFFREAQSVARLNHPSIVSIQNVGQEGDYYYIRMEYVDGDTVENIVKQDKKLDWKLATKIVLDTADALSHAHKKGIIHRDIKPENIMFTTGGQVKVMDFGLAKQVQAATKVSVTGQIVGTPFFMSPEQAGGKTTDARSDIYSLGVTYYYLLTGMKPFNGKNLQEIFLKHFFYTPESPKIYTPELPESVCDIIRRCLKKKKKERYQSAAELCRDLKIALGEEGGTLSAADSEPVYKDDEDATAPKGLMQSGSDPSSATAESGDLAAARAELGADDDSKTVQVSSRARPSLTEAPTEPVSSGDGDEPAAPIQKRGGRGNIDAVASASIVFNRGGAPPTSVPGADGETAAPIERRERVALDQIASASVVFSPKRPATEQATESSADGVGSSTVKLDPKQRAAEPSPAAGTKRAGTTAPRSPVKGVVLALSALGFVALAVFGTYELVGRSQCGALVRRYSDLQKAADPGNDETKWRARANDYQQLALDFDRFTAGFFSSSSGAKDAAEFALKSRDAAKGAFEAANAIARGIKIEDIEKFKKERADADAAVEKARREIGEAEAKGDFARAANLATETWDLWARQKLIGKPFCEAKIRLPLHITVNPPGSRLVTPENAVLGETPATGAPLLLHAVPFQQLKFVAKHAKFKPSALWEKYVTGYEKIPIELERDAKPPVELPQCGPYRVGRMANVMEKVRVDSPFAVDPSAGAILFVSRQGDLWSLDNKLGKPNWQKPVVAGDYGDPSGGPEVLPGRAVFTAGCDGVIRATDPNTGAVVWTQPLNAPVAARPRLTADGFGLIVGTLNGDVIMLDSQGDGPKGKFLWTCPADAAIDTRPAAVGDVVYAGSRDGKLRAIDKKAGSLLTAPYDAQDPICAGPLVVGDRIYIGTRLGSIHALAVSDPSKALFVTPPAGSPIVDLAVSADTIFFATAQEVRAVKVDNGAQVFPPYQPGAQIVGLGLMNGRVAVVAATGEINAIDMTGAVSWTFALKSPKGEFLTVGTPPVVVGEDLYVIAREGWLIVVAAD